MPVKQLITPVLLIRVGRNYFLLAQNDDGRYLFYGLGGMPVAITSEVLVNDNPGWQLTTNEGLLDTLTSVPTFKGIRIKDADIWHTERLTREFDIIFANGRATIRKK